MLSFFKQISQASWFYLKDYYDDERIMRSYRNFIIETLKLMKSTSRNLEQEVDGMIALEKSLAKHLLKTEERRRSTFRQMTLKELIDDIPSVKFYFKKIF